MPTKRIPAEHIKRAQQLRADGRSYKEIGEVFGIGKSAAFRWVHPERAEAQNRRRGDEKRAWNRRKAAERRAQQLKHRFGTVEIPGLLTIYGPDGLPCDFARVDIDDWEALRNIRLSYKAKSRGYASFQVDGRQVYLHRYLLGLEGTQMKLAQTDHINRDTFDNRRANLRVVTAKENCANRGGIFEKAA